MAKSKKATRTWRGAVVDMYVDGVTGETFRAWEAVEDLTCANDACGRTIKRGELFTKQGKRVYNGFVWVTTNSQPYCSDCFKFYVPKDDDYYVL